MKELEGSWLKLTPARRLLVTFRLLGRSLNNGPRLVMVHQVTDKKTFWLVVTVLFGVQKYVSSET